MRGARIRAFAAGVLGAAAMTAASRATGSGVMRELEQLSGAMVLPPRSPATRPLGLAIQFVNGGLLAQLYLEMFDRLPLRAGWRTGLGLGLVHGAVAGVFLSAVPALHPRVPEVIPSPGLFMVNRGVRSAVALAALHALFGAIVGAASRPGSREPA
jgi:hypothetical protein